MTHKLGPNEDFPADLHTMFAELGHTRVFDGPGGLYLEFVPDGLPLKLYRTHLSNNIREQFGVDVPYPMGSLRQRVACVHFIGNAFGWDKIDEEPLELTEAELQLRWYGKFERSGPVTSRGVFDPPKIVPELCIALHAVDAASYWELFSGPFPQVPSEPLQDPKHAWWAQHGAEVVNNLVFRLKRAAPAGFVFEVRNEQFGFYPTAT